MDDGVVDSLPPVQGTLTYSLLRAAASHRTAVTRALYEWDLTATQYLVLVSLEEWPNLSAADLARRWLVRRQSMTVVVSTLERGGLVERVPAVGDRGVFVTRLTESGRTFLGYAHRAAGDVPLALEGAFPVDERDGLRRLLERCERASRGTWEPRAQWWA
jgi:DNA-binding MarR family transcriptional regulator